LSKNFELLQQIEKAEQEVPLVQETALEPKPLPAYPKGASTNGSHNHLALGERSEQEVIKLVHRAFLLNRQNAPRVVVFAGVNPGDGSSSVVASAAEVLAEQGAGSTCVVDANFRTPSLHKFWSLGNDRGLADALKCPDPIGSFVQQVPGRGFMLLPSGNVAPESHALLNDDGIGLRMDELRKTFDNILIDAPAANLYADVLTLGHLADGVILVLKSSATRREAARRVKESFSEAQVRLLGAVLNNRTYPIPQALYERL
jgi:Mrp family chromosome partitioning ATPase